MGGRRLVELRNGRTPAELVAWLADGEPRTVVGLDFAFSFPRWFCEEHGWATAREVWAAMAERGEALIAACEPPLWGRPGRGRPGGRDPYRRTERDGRGRAPKSVFQVGGAGAVGTGSIRGMPCLLELARRGFSIWPFDAPGWPRVIEIYPAALVHRRVNKSRWADRHAYLHERFGDQPPALLERAAGSEDAFDAAVSALAMSEHVDQLAALKRGADAWTAIEGRIWRP